MNYVAFKSAFEQELLASGLPRMGFVKETVDVSDLSRHFEVRVEPFGGQQAPPFFVTAGLEWRWSALQTARTVTSEDDFLREVVGDAPKRRRRSEAPWLRVDVTLSATLDWGKALPLPLPPVWRAWAEETSGRLESIEPLVPKKRFRPGKKGLLEVLAWRGAPELDVVVDEWGSLRLEGVRLAAWEGVVLPRQWSDEETREPSPHPPLRRLFARLKASLHGWSEALDHLAGEPAAPAKGRRG